MKMNNPQTRLNEYPCRCEMGEMENCTLDEIKYMIKNYLLLEVQLDKDGDFFTYIRQWKEPSMMVEVWVPLTWRWARKWKRQRIENGDLYLTDGKQIICIWNGETSLEKFIQKCERIEDEFKDKDFMSHK